MSDDEQRDEYDEVRKATLYALPSATEHKGNPGGDKATASARRNQAVTYRLAGMTYEKIAETLGYYDGGAARNVVMRALEHVEAESVRDLRSVENARLDRAQAAIWPRVLQGENSAVGLYLRISERRARLNGLDAPVQVAVTPTTVEVQQWVAQVLTAAGATDVDVDEADVVDAAWTDTDTGGEEGPGEPTIHPPGTAPPGPP